MLQLRPSCEHCTAALPPDADARICSFECTFCVDCAEGVLMGVCPNCGGNFVPRPIRPSRDWRGGNFLGAYPDATTTKHREADLAVHRALIERLGGLAPKRR